MAWWKWLLRVLVAALVIAWAALVIAWAIELAIKSMFFGYFGPLEYPVKYLHFSALSKERLIHEAKAYIRVVAGGDQMACLYVVECDGEHARLELVSDIVGWDLQAAKDRIWRRRFSWNYCPGRTTNFGLHLIPRAGRTEIEDRSHARWSFFDDGFRAQWGHFEGGSFTDQPWEQCTPERAIVR